MAPQPDLEVRVWEGVELPVWRFENYTDLENFVDDFTGEQSEVELFPELPNPMWGVVFRHFPRDPTTALAMVHIDTGETPECDHL